ncbi:MAG: hypothetical protein KatS3mg095_0701 [Candidatus Parcubacteria bacterium]|nr:MAG: hypothetical protein KatS3mg095_0701 [Candidatus Parcubacteria bacterium]
MFKYLNKFLLTYYLTFNLIFVLFYLNFSIFYSFIFLIESDNFDILEYLWTLGDSVVLFIFIVLVFIFLLTNLFIAILKIIEEHFIFKKRIYSNPLTCRSPPLNILELVLLILFFITIVVIKKN